MKTLIQTTNRKTLVALITEKYISLNIHFKDLHQTKPKIFKDLSRVEKPFDLLGDRDSHHRMKIHMKQDPKLSLAISSGYILLVQGFP